MINVCISTIILVCIPTMIQVLNACSVVFMNITPRQFNLFLSLYPSILGTDTMDPDDHRAYRESFEAFDWNSNGRISYTSLQV